jgi:tetratricopeptide (TPR) repeat protein
MNKLAFSAKGLVLLKQTVVILTIFIFLFALGFTHSLIQYRILVFFAGFLTLLGTIWLIAGKKSPLPLKPFLFLWFAAYSISVILSIDPRRSLSQMFLMLVGVFLFLLAHDLVSRGWKITWFMQSFILVGIVLVLINLSEALGWYLRWISNNPGVWIPTITYRPGTTNLMAPFMYLTFHMGLPFLIQSGKKIVKVGLGIIIFLALVVLYLTSSRGGWLGLFFGLIVWGLYFLTTARGIIKSGFQKLFANKILFTAVTLIASVVVTIGGILLYKQAVHPTHGNIFTSRAGLWGPAITAFKENPIFGQGPFTYGTSFLSENSTPPINVYAHAHGLYHNLLAEMGIFGFLAATLFAIFYFCTFRTQFKKSTQKILHLGIFAFIISCAVHNVFDAFHLEPALLWPFAILAGAAIANPEVEIQNTRNYRPWWVLLLIGFPWFGIWTITPYYQAVELANQNQWQPAFEKFEQAVQRDPWNGLTHQQLALSAAVLAQQGDPTMLDVAIKALQTTIQHEPSWALNHANLATLYLANNNPDQAILSAQKAFELAPRASLYALNLGYILEQTGDDAQARSNYQKSLDLNPSWATASFWMETPLRTAIRDSWLLDNPVNPPSTIEEAEATLANNPHVSWAYNQLAKVQLEQGKLDAAQQTLENAGLAYVNTSVDSIETQWLWAELYAKTGDLDKAIETGNNVINRYNSYGIYGPGSFGVLQYAPRVFRMSAMAIEIVPQMVDVPVPAIWLERADLLKFWQEKVQ